MRIFLAAGVRPNFVNIAPMIRALEASEVEVIQSSHTRFVQTGERYEHGMSQSFPDNLGMRVPDPHIGYGSQIDRPRCRWRSLWPSCALRESPSDLVLMCGELKDDGLQDRARLRSERPAGIWGEVQIVQSVA